MQAVERNAVEPVRDCPVHEFVDAVEGWIGALEAAGEIHVRKDYMALKLFDADGAVALDLNVAHGMIGESRLVAFAVRVAFEDVDVDLVALFVGTEAGAMAIVELAGFVIDEAAVFEKLAGVLDGYFGAARPFQPQPGPAAE